jgi:hypothetical protein
MPDTFPDILNVVLSDWKKFLKFVLLLFVSGGCLIGLFCLVLYFLPQHTDEVQIEGLGRVIFSQKTKEGQSYVVVVHPQGWQETSISVSEGDKISFDADGSVQIDLIGLLDSLKQRKDLETRNGKRQFTPAESNEIRPKWLWTNPDGNHLTQQMADPERLKISLAPDHNYGALLAAIRETGVIPTQGDVFFIGTHNVIQKATKTGKIYFTVNDAWDYKDPIFPEKFFVDNLGFFYVRVIVKSAK